MSYSVHTLSSFVDVLKKEQEEERRNAEANRMLFEEATGKIFPCIKFEYSEKYPTPTEEESKREVLVAKCPQCENVDNRFMLKYDKERSSFIVLETYAGSGVDLKCLCCQNEFKFCSGQSLWEKKNCVPVPLAFLRDGLGVDINKYM